MFDLIYNLRAAPVTFLRAKMLNTEYPARLEVRSPMHQARICYVGLRAGLDICASFLNNAELKDFVPSANQELTKPLKGRPTENKAW